MSLRYPSRPLLVAITSAVMAAAGVGVWLLWRVLVTTSMGRKLDQLAMWGALHGRSTLWQYAEQVLEPVSVVYGLVTVVVVVAIALLRRRYRMAVQAVVLLVGSTATTQLLKHVVLARPDFGDFPNYGNTLPSGHTTAAAATSAALLFVVSPQWRPLVAVAGTFYTVATGWSTLVGQWHRPSDVMAAVLVVTGWSAVAALLMSFSHLPVSTATTTMAIVTPGRTDSGRTVIGLGLTAVISGAVTVLLLIWQWASPTTDDLFVYGAAVAAIVATTSLGFAVQLALREAAGRVVNPRKAPVRTGR